MKQTEKSADVSRTGTCVFDCQREAFEILLHSAAMFSTVLAQESNNFRSGSQMLVLSSRSSVSGSRRVRDRIS